MCRSSSCHALNQLGFGGVMPVCGLWPVLNEEIWKRSFEAVVALRPRLPVDWKELLGGNALLLPKAQLASKVLPAWRVQ
eukprot:7981044-Alexandrium_andersonii.AAC.1